MHFKRLRLNGFKSFVDPTELLIEEGVTGIVGPNGCGKSNLLEALRWVMGETSAKSMRGSGMDDVIFAGTDRRNARPYAEVILTLDNSDRMAPAQFNHTDILEISRKITRDMGSNYRLNGKEVRARDLQILFADAATGSNSPALVRQGQINQLIHAKPKQRRVILEEAAGIGGLYSRRHEAELRLRAASTNLERVEDILKSTESQINSLRRQSRQAEKYKALSTEIRQTEALHLAVLYEKAANDKRTAERDLRKISDDVASAEIAQSELLRKETELQEKVHPLREEFAIASAVLKRAEIEAAGIQAEITEADNRIHRLNRAQENVTKDREREIELLSDADQLLVRVKHELSEMSQAEDDSPEEMAYLQSRLDIGQKELTASENKLEQLRNQISELQSRNKSLTENADHARSRKLRLENDFIHIADQETKARQAVEENFATQHLQDKTNSLTENITILKETLQNLENSLKNAQENDKSSREIMLNAESKSNKLQAEIRGLSSVVERSQTKGSAKVIEQISVTSGYEKAIGVILGDDVSFDDNPTQPRFWRLLPCENKVTLPIGAMPLSHYIHAAPEFLKIALSRVGVVDEEQGETLQNSLAAGACLVSTSGKLWRSDGFVIRDGSKTQASVILEQKNRLEELRRNLEAANKESADARVTYEKAKEERQKILNEEQSTKNTLRDTEKEYNQIERKIYDIQNNRKIAENKLHGITERKTLIERELSEADQTLHKALDDLEKISGTDHLQQETEKLKQSVTEKRMSLSDTRALLESHKRATKEREGRFKTLNKDYSEWQGRSEKAKKRIEEFDKRLHGISRDLNDASGKPEALYKKKAESASKVTMALERHDSAKEASEGLEGELSIVTKDLRKAQEYASSCREKKARAEERHETTILKEKEILERIREKVENTPDDLKHELDAKIDENTPNAQALEEKLRELNRARDGLGPVNLVAEKELSEVEERSSSLINEKNDLLVAMKKLNNAINDINKEGRARMLKAFDIVNNHFKKLFQHLFSGGVAELELIESDDPLEAGLEVNARPPGKKTNSLSLLSGGEQALTCMALIFAVFLTNPSPICVLDEVDAPLDDANVERYCNLINEMTKVTDTRFLVITHHALTMARTDRLFGVTMAERGVSQLVSVDLKAAEKLLEEAIA